MCIEGSVLANFADVVLLPGCAQGMACGQGAFWLDSGYTALVVQLLTWCLSAQGKLVADSILEQVVSVALATILAPFEAAWLMS